MGNIKRERYGGRSECTRIPLTGPHGYSKNDRKQTQKRNMDSVADEQGLGKRRKVPLAASRVILAHKSDCNGGVRKPNLQRGQTEI